MKFRLEKKRKKIKPPSKLVLVLAPWRLQIFVGLGLVLVIALALTATWYGTRVASLQIATITVVGGSTIPHDLIEKTAKDALVGSYYKLVPYTFALWYPSQRVQDQVMQIPRIKNVHAEVVDQNLMIAFEEYQPFALWCETIESSICFFLDATGFAFAPAPLLNGSAFIRYIESGKAPELKVQAFAPDYVENTGMLAERLESELDLYVTEVVRKDAVDTSYFLAGGAEIKVSERMSADETFTNLQTVFSSEDFTEIADGGFHYIDLRFGDKVFVSEVEVVASTTSTTTGEVVE